jgi:cytochrome P450 family 6
LTLEGQEWKERRAKLSPVFTSGKMKLMFDIVNTIGDKFVEVTDKEISKSPKMEVGQILARFTTDVISNVAFGLDSKCKTLILLKIIIFLKTKL